MGFWESTVTVIGVFGITSLMIWLGLHYGTKLIDKMLYIPPPADPTKPIIAPRPRGE